MYIYNIYVYVYNIYVYIYIYISQKSSVLMCNSTLDDPQRF